LIGELLTADQQHRMVVPGLHEVRESRLVEMPEVNAPHLGT
jgi:hypothetical protein